MTISPVIADCPLLGELTAIEVHTFSIGHVTALFLAVTRARAMIRLEVWYVGCGLLVRALLGGAVATRLDWV